MTDIIGQAKVKRVDMELSLIDYNTDLMMNIYKFNYKCLEEVLVRVTDHEDEMKSLLE